jgi:ATP-dependent DNA ligase
MYAQRNMAAAFGIAPARLDAARLDARLISSRCDPVLRKVPPSGDEWLYETKWNSYRGQLRIRLGKIIAHSRRVFIRRERVPS